MKVEKVENLVVNLHDRRNYIRNIRNLKETLNHELVLKKGSLKESLNSLKNVKNNFKKL